MSSYQEPVLAPVLEFLKKPHGLYIDGQEVESGTEQTLNIYNPADGRVIATCADATKAQVDRAVSSAWQSFVQKFWVQMLPVQKERILLKFADLVEAHADELAQLLTLEQGKSLGMAKALEVNCAVQWMRYTAGLVTKHNGHTLDVSIPFPEGAQYKAWTTKEPIGVVVGVVPCNFPLLIGVWKILPALAAGCSVVIKPSETTPITMLRLAELATLAGVPDGVFNVVTGQGSGCGQWLISHPLVNKVSFTGSTDIGKKVAVSAAADLKEVALELGGNNPAIVLKDIDPNVAVEGLLASSFLNQGQVCAASSRIYVEAPLFDSVASQFEEAIKSMHIGSGFDPQAQINPLSTYAQQRAVESHLTQIRDQGVEIITGQQTPQDGFYVSPTLIINPEHSEPLTQKEVFGPVINLTRVSDENEALQLANDSDYGLCASVWTNKLDKAMTYSNALKAGTVWVNSHAFIDPNMPFGGIKLSGSGRDFGVNWLDAFSETKSLCIRY
ncbi:NAD-dependent phenylacetaldehyde dehydrogenase [Pseudoalteromonas sp. MSK9-3]|uniref:aldehyde dehydrogenase family protein n=1 Tax=Pseudoalteromonas sp. MSK9-3 TaxID=1897633 RepID=UPI000E6C4A3C|nr:aldehyde dehydrogenase family protein [Pseudoalteromonas sp. MSK9-3]RJE77183.1 NAD-dependent phenylacetaldehyde dehydrogenase [Pseudoalteromonas sp. MSK9-3]